MANFHPSEVSFFCQRCSLPLKLDRSFLSIEDNLVKEFIAPLSYDVENRDQPNVFNADEEETKKIIKEAFTQVVGPAPANSTDSSGNGFMLLGNSEPSHTENLSHKLKVTSSLFDILSCQSEVDHPLCEECTDTLLDQLDEQLELTEKECQDYKELLEKLNEDNEEDIDEKAIDTELEKLRIEEKEIIQQLESIEKEHTQIVEQIEERNKESKHLDEEEKRYYHEYNEYKRQLLECEDARRSVDNQLKYAQKQLDLLKSTNVFNATFFIWHSGHFGTINNFRLGRLPSVPVEWSEINAAWGQTVLLLHSLAKKINLNFQRYRLIPYGAHSKIESLSDKTKDLPLFGSGSFKILWDKRFDQAMVAFLDCLQQFKENVESGDNEFHLPYKMEKGKIEETSTGQSYSIRRQFNNEEQWTKALKFVLTNLKWGVVWVSIQFDS